MANNPRLKTINQFKSRLAGGGARPNLFEVAIDKFPSYAEGLWTKEKDDFRFLCKAANLPASNVAPIDVPFRGRILKVAGDRTFDPWTITVINDEDWAIRTAFEGWMNGISKLDNNSGTTSPISYMVDANVYQLGHGETAIKDSDNQAANGPSGRITGEGGETSAVLRQYQFVDIWPSNISEIALSYETGDTIEEFTVEFQVQYWRAINGIPKPIV
jgi:hypothetical protein